MFFELSFLYLALLFFVLNKNKHYKEVFLKTSSDSFIKTSKVLAWSFLFISLILFVNKEGLSLGLTYFIAFLTPLIFLLAVILAYRAKYLFHFSILVFILFYLI